MRITQRQVALGMQIMVLIGLAGIAIYQVVAGGPLFAIIANIAGVSMIDSIVARGLLNTAQALRLLGCAVTLSGISPEVAMTLVNLDIGLESVATARSPREALASYFADGREVTGGA